MNALEHRQAGTLFDSSGFPDDIIKETTESADIL
jgi:alanyl-tRNA synthetase